MKKTEFLTLRLSKPLKLFVKKEARESELSAGDWLRKEINFLKKSKEEKK